MRTGQTNPRLLHHQPHRLILFIILITGALANVEETQALLGGSVSFNFKVTKDMILNLAEWYRCPNQKVFVFSPIHGLTISDNSYDGRLSVKSNNSFKLEKIQESDFVTYCYKLSTFPDGSLEGKIMLVKKTPQENGSPITLIISVSCAIGLIVLCAISAGVVCYKRRSKLANTALNPGGLPGGQNNPKSTQSQEEERTDDFKYLN